MATPGIRTICHQLNVSRPISADQVLLLDLWGKTREPGAVFADITWVGVTAAQVPAETARAFGAIAEARDAAVRWSRTRPGRTRAARVGGRSGGAHGARGPGYGDASCTAPATVLARTFMAMASTWTTTRRTTIGGCSRHRIHG